jgi:hypothetical protein
LVTLRVKALYSSGTITSSLGLPNCVTVKHKVRGSNCLYGTLYNFAVAHHLGGVLVGIALMG